MNMQRPIKLLRNGPNQSVEIPREFELPGEDAVMRKEGDKLIIEPAKKKVGSLAVLFASWEPEDFPEIDDLPSDSPPDLG